MAGCYPEQASGFGPLDTGTGSMEKVRVAGGKPNFAINRIQPDGSTNMVAYLIICSKTYEIFGDRLGKVRLKEGDQSRAESAGHMLPNGSRVDKRNS